MKIKSNRLNYPILTMAFVVYILLLVWIIVLKFNSADNIQSGFELQRLPLSVRFEVGLVPLVSSIGEIRSYGYPKEALANIACFIPFGIFVFVIYYTKKRNLFQAPARMFVKICKNNLKKTMICSNVSNTRLFVYGGKDGKARYIQKTDWG